MNTIDETIRAMIREEIAARLATLAAQVAENTERLENQPDVEDAVEQALDNVDWSDLIGDAISGFTFSGTID